jgi:ferredoxin
MRMDALRRARAPVTVDAPLCSRFRTPRSSCRACADVCPTEAIRIAERGAEIAGRCHGCGACFAACPNGAFRIAGKDDRALVGAIRERCTPAPAVFRIRCARGAAPAELVVPCLGRLTETLVLEPLRLGASATEILQPACASCPSARAATGLPRVLGRARGLAEQVGRGREAVSERAVPLRGVPGEGPPPVTRRAFLGGLRGQTEGTPPPPAPEGTDSVNTGPSFRELLEQRRESEKRPLPRVGPGGAPAGGGAPTVGWPRRTEPVTMAAGDAPLAELKVTSRCTGCGVCATLCPAGAITASWTEEDFRLGYRPRDCTGCRVCVIVCGPRAIRATDRVRLDALFLESDVPLLRVARATCRRCRDPFPANGSETCPLCSHLRDRQEASLHLLFKERQPCIPSQPESANGNTASSRAST